MDKFSRYATLSLLVVSVILNVALSMRLRESIAEASVLGKHLVAVKSEMRLAPGQKAPTLSGRDVADSGWNLSFAASDRPTLLYIFSPSCIWCSRNRENVETLLKASRSSYRIIGISLSQTPVEERLEQVRNFGFPIVFDVAPASVAAYRLGGTPQTILIDSGGTVLENWSGAYSGELAVEIEKRFQISLPGLKG